ncbi:hypothetical protein L1049_017566 [Liquidambar formosana]|uniref:Patatin n=1 Tax=Liquidambar formosana TaxID=63359 RepID=A0AAP0S1E8_LIQFO
MAMEFIDTTPMNGQKMLVLSLGTGTAKDKGRYNAATASKWGLLDWVFNDGATPLIDIFQDASSDLVDYHVTTVFKAFHSEKNYPRIQNLQNLVQIGEKLLNKRVSRVNLETGKFVEVVDAGTNREALTGFAELLSAEKKLKVAN